MNVSINDLNGAVNNPKPVILDAPKTTSSNEASVFNFENAHKTSDMGDLKILNEILSTDEELQATEQKNIDKIDDKKQEGYLKGAKEEIVSSKPTEEQQGVIDNVVEQIIDKYPGETQDSTVYKDEDGNILKEEMTKQDEDGNTYTTVIEYDDKGRVSNVYSQNEDGNPIDGTRASFEYNEDGTISVEKGFGKTYQEGTSTISSSDMMYHEPYLINLDGSVKNNGVLSRILGI